MPYDFAYFDRVYTAWDNGGRKKPIVEVVKSLVTTGKTTSYGCFALSCMCCVCCTKCGQACFLAADKYEHWKDALAIYEGVSPAVVNRIFADAIVLLRTMRQRFQPPHHENHLVNDMALIKFEMEFAPSEWLKTLYNRLELASESIPATPAEITLLWAVYPILFMAARPEYSLGTRTKEVVRQNIQKVPYIC